MSAQAMANFDALLRKKIAKRLNELQASFCIQPQPLELSAATTAERLDVRRARRLRFKPVAAGLWGVPHETTWFRLQGTVPRAFAGESVWLRFDLGGQGLVFRDDEPVKGLDAFHELYELFRRCKGGEKVDLLVEAYPPTHVGRFGAAAMKAPVLVVFVQEVWDAIWDGRVLLDLMDQLPQGDTWRAKILYGLNKAVDAVDWSDQSRSGLKQAGRRLRQALKPLYAHKAVDSAQTFACMGHAHIDVAWLWPLAETKRKCGRTFSTVLGLMDRYPEFVFAQSQPQLYEYTREKYPGLFKRITRKVKNGQWQPTGCMWVEADCNITSGESFVRQILHGTRYMLQHFGSEPDCLWLPDVFGYSAALPQLLRASGIKYFLTQKISWNQFTQFPYHSFWWEGVDGSRVLSHFPPTQTYASNLATREILDGEKRYREKAQAPIQALLYGYGDGGGGPTMEMCERIRRSRDLEGLPRMDPMSPREFFGRLEKHGRELPQWVGELYLEYHRGSLTTQASVKRNNRLAEFRLREAELLSVLGLNEGSAYPQGRLQDAWQKVLLNQFHDIIPGTSIPEVYEDTARDYASALQTTSEVIASGFERYVRRVDTRGDGLPVVVFNPLSWTRRGLVVIDGEGLDARSDYVAVGPNGDEAPLQQTAEGKRCFLAEAPSLGHSVYRVKAGTATFGEVQVSRRRLENDRLRVDLDAQGRIRRVYDKVHNREVLSAPANVFQLFEDKPAAWDAWDIDVYYKDKLLEQPGKLESSEVMETGPVRGVLRQVRSISKSTITQDLVLTAGSAQIDFVTRVDWGDELNVLLKVAFPVNVHAEQARYEIQFGNVMRPTHDNLPQHRAMFEVAAQKWADLSENGYGVALLNDCKYGYDTRGNVLRLTLLRAPKRPDPDADVNQAHHFTYSLLPHAGDFAAGGEAPATPNVVQAGYELNVPLLTSTPTASAGDLAPQHANLTLQGYPGVIVEAVKKAEDDDGVIVRLYESLGGRGTCTLQAAWNVSDAAETDLMERPLKKLSLKTRGVALAFTPFQIRTIKLTSARATTRKRKARAAVELPRRKTTRKAPAPARRKRRR